MAKWFQDKVVWITGSSSGIGEATAYRFAQESARLILTALEEDVLLKVKEKCLSLGAPAVEILPFDLSKTEELEDLATKAWNSFGRIDVFYNNAGISQRGTTVETQMSVIRKVMDVDYYAPVILTKAVLPKMIAQGGGQLVVTTSIAGLFGFPLRCAYSSAKHALYGFFETVQAEYYSQNIRVTIVCPGRVRTNISFYALEKDGSRHGKLDAGQAGGVTPEQAANKIVKAVYRKKREVMVGRKELLMAYIKRFFPGLAARIARSIKAM
jgi:short-subunit dehydrogenase